MNLSDSWDTFIANPYINGTRFNESLFNELLHRSMKDILLSEEQFETIQESYESSKADAQKLKLEKKQLEDKGGRKQRSIQEEMRLKQIQKEIKSSKMRYKRQGNKMRRTQRISSTLTDKLDKLLNVINHNNIAHLHFILISFCIKTLSEIQLKFAPNHENMQEIYSYLSEKKNQTKPLLASLLKWIHSYSDDPSNIVQQFVDNDRNLWILYIICCAFPALFIPVSIHNLKDKAALSVLLHYLLPKYPIITMKMIHNYMQNKDIHNLKKILIIAQFHPKLWNQIQSQPFVQTLFQLLFSSFNENEMELLFGFENLMIQNDDLSKRFAMHLADIIVSLDDFDKYMNHNINIKYVMDSNANNGSMMLFLCDTFNRLKQCDLNALIRHKNIIKSLCLMDHSFCFNIIVKLIIDHDITQYFGLFDTFHQQITNDIDMIAYYALKQKLNANKMKIVMKNLCFICNKLQIQFVINSCLVSEMKDLWQHIDDDMLQMLHCINVQKLPKNIAIIICRYLFHGMIQSKDNTLKHRIIELILKLREFDGRISKEPIELCISYILCPDLNGDKITKLKPKQMNKKHHKKILTPKIRINPYANALLKQIDSTDMENVELLKKLIDNKHENIASDIKLHQRMEPKRNDNTDFCWYLLSKLSRNYVPYFSNFIQCILPGIHLEPSHARYAESVQKGAVLMFDHDVLVLFESYPNLWFILKLFCAKIKISEDNTTHNDILVYLRSLTVSYYIKCAKYTKQLRANGIGMKKSENDEAFYHNCNMIFECMYLSGKISLRFYKMMGLLFDLELNEIDKLLRHICNLCLQPLQQNMIQKSTPSFPLKLNDKMLEAEKRMIRQILLQNTELMSKYTKFVASILSM